MLKYQNSYSEYSDYILNLTNMHWDSAVPGTVLNTVDRVGSQTAKLAGKDFQNDSLIREMTC